MPNLIAAAGTQSAIFGRLKLAASENSSIGFAVFALRRESGVGEKPALQIGRRYPVALHTNTLIDCRIKNH